MGVNMDEGQGLAAGSFASQFKPGDVDPVLSEDRKMKKYTQLSWFVYLKNSPEGGIIPN